MGLQEQCTNVEAAVLSVLSATLRKNSVQPGLAACGVNTSDAALSIPNGQIGEPRLTWANALPADRESHVFFVVSRSC
jgi:hypothetical protein